MPVRKSRDSQSSKGKPSTAAKLAALALGIVVVMLVLSGGDKEPVAQQGPDDGQPTQQATAIPGLTPTDVKLNLEQQWGLEFTGPRQIAHLCLDQGTAVDPDTGISLICDICENTVGLDVARVVFTVDAASLAQCTQVSADLVTSLASRYLGYCATLPYDGAEPQAAKEWVEAHVSEATGVELTTTIGGVIFRLYGTDLVKVLEIAPDEGS